MGELLVIIASVTGCSKTIIENHTSSWEDLDSKTLKRASVRCEYYYENSPCLKRFIKKEPRVYNAICGAK